MSSITSYNNLDNLVYSLKTNNLNINSKKYYLLNTNINYNYNSNKKIIIKTDITSNKKSYSLRCWLSTCLFNFYTENKNYDNTIFSLDLIENDKNIKIDYLEINNDYYDKEHNFNKKILSDNEVLILKKAIFDYIENFAISKNKNKIIIDIHNNMKRYDKELKEEGFVNTNNKCIDNPFWYEAVKEIIINNNKK